jgi:hypothetical protein
MPIRASTANASFSAMPSVSPIVRRIARTATGPFAAIRSAIWRAAAARLAPPAGPGHRPVAG